MSLTPTFPRVAAVLLALTAFPPGRAPGQSNDLQESQFHFKVALVALKHSDLDIAAEELSRAANLAPRDGLIQYNLANVLNKKGDAAAALERLQVAIRLGLPAKEREAAEDLLPNLTYQAKSQPLTDFIGGWTREISEGQPGAGPCPQQSTYKVRLLLPAQTPQDGTLQGDYTLSYYGSIDPACDGRFKASGARVLTYSIAHRAAVSRVDNKLSLQLENGQCSGSCQYVNTLGSTFLLATLSANEIWAVGPSDDTSRLLLREAPKDLKNRDPGRSLAWLAGRWVFTDSGTDPTSNGANCREDWNSIWTMAIESDPYYLWRAKGRLTRSLHSQWAPATRRACSRLPLSDTFDSAYDFTLESNAIPDAATLTGARVNCTLDDCGGPGVSGELRKRSSSSFTFLGGVVGAKHKDRVFEKR